MVLRQSKSNALNRIDFERYSKIQFIGLYNVIRLMIMTQIQCEITFPWVEMIKMKTRSSSVRIKCSQMTNDCFIGFNALNRRFAIKAALYELEHHRIYYVYFLLFNEIRLKSKHLNGSSNNGGWRF